MDIDVSTGRQGHPQLWKGEGSGKSWRVGLLAFPMMMWVMLPGLKQKLRSRGTGLDVGGAASWFREHSREFNGK